MLGFELGNGKTVVKQWELRGIDILKNKERRNYARSVFYKSNSIS